MSNKVKISLVISILLIIIIVLITIISSGVTIKNPTKDKTATIINEVEPYETDYVYNESMPSDAEPIILEEGINGLNYTYDGLNYVHLSNQKNQVVQKGSGKPGNYTGKLTGYGPDCPGCSAVGNVSCKTKEGTNHSLITDGIYYNDYMYGSVRIIAADNSAFPCGTIIKIDNKKLDEFYAVVLDTGSTMRNAWASGNVWIDLAFSSQSAAAKGNATSNNTSFNVQRWGW